MPPSPTRPRLCLRLSATTTSRRPRPGPRLARAQSPLWRRMRNSPCRAPPAYVAWNAFVWSGAQTSNASFLRARLCVAPHTIAMAAFECLQSLPAFLNLQCAYFSFPYAGAFQKDGSARGACTSSSKDPQGKGRGVICTAEQMSWVIDMLLTKGGQNLSKLHHHAR